MNAKNDPVRALIGQWREAATQARKDAENPPRLGGGEESSATYRAVAEEHDYRADQLEAALAQQAGADRPVFCASFGFGGVAVSTAKFGDPAVPAVLLREVETVGVIGSPVEAGELRAVLTFPTEDQAQRVFNSFTNAPQPAIPAAEIFAAGWHLACDWAGREDLHSDEGSPAYEADRAARLAALVQSDKGRAP